MTLLIGDNMIESTSGRAFAAPAGKAGRWVVSWMDGIGAPTVSRTQAITAVTLAEHIGTHPRGECAELCPQWGFVSSWSRELGLTAAEVVNAVNDNWPDEESTS